MKHTANLSEICRELLDVLGENLQVLLQALLGIRPKFDPLLRRVGS